MGSRGPLKRQGAALEEAAERQRRLGNPGKRSLPALIGSGSGAQVPARPFKPPAAPKGLAAAGAAVWKTTWPAAPWLGATDIGSVESLARLVDELNTYRKALAEHGPLVEEPIVTPKGEVVGRRLTANPAEAMARRAEKAVLEWRTALGLTPAARARLGLALIETERQMTRLERLLEARNRGPDGRR